MRDVDPEIPILHGQLPLGFSGLLQLPGDAGVLVVDGELLFHDLVHVGERCWFLVEGALENGLEVPLDFGPPVAEDLSPEGLVPAGFARLRCLSVIADAVCQWRRSVPRRSRFTRRSGSSFGCIHAKTSSVTFSQLGRCCIAGSGIALGLVDTVRHAYSGY